MTFASRAVRVRSLGFLAVLLGSGCAHYPYTVHLDSPSIVPKAYVAQGIASWYGPGFHGRKTASGVRFNQHDLTCAHRTLPFGTRLKVTNLDNGEELLVTVNDRGPYVRSRIVDLSKEAARRLDILKSGTAHVRLETVSPSEEQEVKNDVPPIVSSNADPD